MIGLMEGIKLALVLPFISIGMIVAIVVECISEGYKFQRKIMLNYFNPNEEE